MVGHTAILFIMALVAVLPEKDDKPIRASYQDKTSITWTVGWSYDNSFVAIGNDNGELSIYETTGWKKIKSWKFTATTITRVEWSPKHPVLAVASYSYQMADSVVQLFDVIKNETVKLRPDSLQGRCVTWSSDGEKVAFVGTSGRISICSKSGRHLKTLSFKNPSSLFDIDWHPAKNILLAVEEQIYLIDIDRDSVIATYDDGSKNKGILCCQWHTSGDFFVTGDYGHENEGEPSYLKYWSADGKLKRRVEQAKAEYRNVRWTRDGKFLAASADVLLVLNTKGDVIKKTKFDANNLWGVGWNKAGNRILSSDQAGNIRISDINGKVMKTFRQ